MVSQVLRSMQILAVHILNDLATAPQDPLSSCSKLLLFHWHNIFRINLKSACRIFSILCSCLKT